jgi:hypothetical protein
MCESGLGEPAWSFPPTAISPPNPKLKDQKGPSLSCRPLHQSSALLCLFACSLARYTTTCCGCSSTTPPHFSFTSIVLPLIVLAVIRLHRCLCRRRAAVSSSRLDRLPRAFSLYTALESPRPAALVARLPFRNTCLLTALSPLFINLPRQKLVSIEDFMPGHHQSSTYH